jgi:hypothetical protein
VLLNKESEILNKEAEKERREGVTGWHAVVLKAQSSMPDPLAQIPGFKTQLPLSSNTPSGTSLAL